MAKITKVSIYDMDGTIVDSSHRYRTIVDENGERIDLAYWRENEYRAMEDSLLPMAEQYRRDIQDENCYVIIATARVMNDPDWQFVKEVLGEPDYAPRPQNHLEQMASGMVISPKLFWLLVVAYSLKFSRNLNF